MPVPVALPLLELVPEAVREPDAEVVTVSVGVWVCEDVMEDVPVGVALVVGVWVAVEVKVAVLEPEVVTVEEREEVVDGDGDGVALADGVFVSTYCT